jgi:hypothetical protein
MLTSKAYSIGGNNDDDFAQAVADSSGNVYAAGSTWSTSMTNGERDIAILRFKSTGDIVWVKYWGTVAEEQATGIALDESGGYLYISGYTITSTTASDGTVSKKYDMVLLRVTTNGLMDDTLW